jgi:hypothetical protein
MDDLVPFVFAGIILYVVYRQVKHGRQMTRKKREHLINTFIFPSTINSKISDKYPHLSEQETKRVIYALREYFHLCNIAGKKAVSMPSQVVDVAWHEFILFTRQYETFCSKALGRFLHHTPAEAMKSKYIATQGIKTAWKASCFRENMDAKAATRLPLLFALDDELQIPDGFKYSLNCKANGKTDYYCAGHIGCNSGCAGDGFKDADSANDYDGCAGGDGCGGD